MCWMTKYKPVLETAKKDIPVKKVLEKYGDGQLCSPYFVGFTWEIGKVYEAEMDEPMESDGDYVIESGFHSAEEIEQIEADENGIGYYNVFLANNHTIVLSLEKLDIYDAVIPAESNFYVNEYGEFVSDRLKIIGKSELN